MIVFKTERLVIRSWTEPDRAAYAKIVADPAARRFFRRTMSRPEVDLMADGANGEIAKHGWGRAAVERHADRAIIGLVMLSPLSSNLPVRGDGLFEIGWQLGTGFVGAGYASEAAKGWIDYAWAELPAVMEIVALTTKSNQRSERVMRRLGMARDYAGDFDHPMIPVGHPLRPHLVYRLKKPPSGMSN